MTLYPRYALAKFYLWSDRHFWKFGYAILAIICIYFLVGLILTVIHVESRRVASRAQYQQQQKDREIMKRLKK